MLIQHTVSTQQRHQLYGAVLTITTIISIREGMEVIVVEVVGQPPHYRISGKEEEEEVSYRYDRRQSLVRVDCMASLSYSDG